MNLFSKVARAAALSFCAAGPTLAADKDLTFAIGLPPIHMWATVYEYVDENLESRTKDALGVEVYYGSLLNLKQSLTGLRDGIADSAMLVPGITPPRCRRPT